MQACMGIKHRPTLCKLYVRCKCEVCARSRTCFVFHLVPFYIGARHDRMCFPIVARYDRMSFQSLQDTTGCAFPLLQDMTGCALSLQGTTGFAFLLLQDTTGRAFLLLQGTTGFAFLLLQDTTGRAFLLLQGTTGCAFLSLQDTTGCACLPGCPPRSRCVWHVRLQDDLICLPAKLSASLGGIGPLVMCSKVSNQISLIDFCTLRCACCTPQLFHCASCSWTPVH